MLRLKRLLHAENSTGLAETSYTAPWEQKHCESLTGRSVFVMRGVHTEMGAAFTESPYMQSLFSPGSPLEWEKEGIGCDLKAQTDLVIVIRAF